MIKQFFFSLKASLPDTFRRIMIKGCCRCRCCCQIISIDIQMMRASSPPLRANPIQRTRQHLFRRRVLKATELIDLSRRIFFLRPFYPCHEQQTWPSSGRLASRRADCLKKFKKCGTGRNSPTGNGRGLTSLVS